MRLEGRQRGGRRSQRPCPYVSADAAASVVADGGDFTAFDPTLSEIVVDTDKVDQLIKVSREQLAQPGAAELLARSMTLALITGSLSTPSRTAAAAESSTCRDAAQAAQDTYVLAIRDSA